MTQDELRVAVATIIDPWAMGRAECDPETETAREVAYAAADAIIPLVTSAVWPMLADAHHHAVTEHGRMLTDFKAMSATLNRYYEDRRPLNPANTRYERPV